MYTTFYMLVTSHENLVSVNPIKTIIESKDVPKNFHDLVKRLKRDYKDAGFSKNTVYLLYVNKNFSNFLFSLVV